MDLKYHITAIALSLASLCYCATATRAAADFAWPWEQAPVQKILPHPTRVANGPTDTSVSPSKSAIGSKSKDLSPRSSFLLANSVVLGIGF
jgi:hypothetical protein